MTASALQKKQRSISSATRQSDTVSPAQLLISARNSYATGRIGKAIGLLEQVCAAQAENREARTLLFACYKDGGRLADMLDMARRFADSPASPDELALAWSAWLSVCDFDAAEKIQPEVLQAAMQGKLSTNLLPALLLTANGLPQMARQDMFALHRIWAETQPAAQPLDPARFEVRDRVRIAYVSGDFCRHPVSYFILSILASHDRSCFEVFCYSNTHQPADDMTAALRQASDHFIDITELGDAQLGERMQRDGIHIAVDLAGHTANSRTPAFALRLAPVQVSWLGYANTSGLDAMDFHISDRHAEDEASGTIYAEKLLYMPASFLCYGIAWEVEVIDTPPCEKHGSITFASFNNGRKLNREVIGAWARILQAVDASRLLFKFAGCGQAQVQDNLRREFAAHGVQAERIEFLPRSDTVGEHIACYHQVDIALDTFPYSGTTTTFEALSQGVPVITLSGAAHCNRVSYSILKNIGYEETITDTPEAYMQRAVQLARNPKALGVLRGVIPLLLKHAACNQPEPFTCDLESLLVSACNQRRVNHA